MPTVEQMVNQVRYGLGRFYNARDSWCILNKGSFFDERQVPEKHRSAIARCLSDEGVKSVFIESRPEFVTKGSLRSFHQELGVDRGLAIGLGLEVSDERILNLIRKGISLRVFEECIGLLKRYDVRSQAFLMAGLPGATEPETTLESIRYAKEIGSDQIMVSATVPLRGTELRRMWQRQEWQPIDIALFSKIVDSAKTIFEPKDVDVWLCGIYAYQSGAQRGRYKRHEHKSTPDQLRIEDFTTY